MHPPLIKYLHVQIHIQSPYTNPYPVSFLCASLPDSVVATRLWKTGPQGSTKGSPRSFHKCRLCPHSRLAGSESVFEKSIWDVHMHIKMLSNTALAWPAVSCLLWLNSHGFPHQIQVHSKVRGEEGKRDGENAKWKGTLTFLEHLLQEAGPMLWPCSRIHSHHQHYLCTRLEKVLQEQQPPYEGRAQWTGRWEPESLLLLESGGAWDLFFLSFPFLRPSSLSLSLYTHTHTPTLEALPLWILLRIPQNFFKKHHSGLEPYLGLLDARHTRWGNGKEGTTSNSGEKGKGLLRWVPRKQEGTAVLQWHPGKLTWHVPVSVKPAPKRNRLIFPSAVIFFFFFLAQVYILYMGSSHSKNT